MRLQRVCVTVSHPSSGKNHVCLWDKSHLEENSCDGKQTGWLLLYYELTGPICFLQDKILITLSLSHCLRKPRKWRADHSLQCFLFEADLRLGPSATLAGVGGGQC